APRPGHEGYAMISIRTESGNDVAARDALLDEAYGPSRFRKPSETIRRGRKPALLLGPLAVACDRQGEGIGAALMAHAIDAARLSGHAAILLVGDAAYYGRFGFTADKTARLAMPGPFERHRLLGLELQPGALDAAAGLIAPAGRPVAKPRRRAA